MSTLAERLRQALATIGMSGQAFEVAAELPRGYASRLLSGQRGKRMDPEMTQRMADVLGVRHEWLAMGTEPMRAEGSDSPPPARPRAVEAIEAPRVYDDGIEWLIFHATDKARHQPEDQTAVRAFAAKRGPLLRKDQDMVGLVERWLDVAAALRRKGVVPTFSAMIDALTLSPMRAEFVDAEGLTEFDHMGAQIYKEQSGLDAPPPWPPADRSPVPPPIVPRPAAKVLPVAEPTPEPPTVQKKRARLRNRPVPEGRTL